MRLELFLWLFLENTIFHNLCFGHNDSYSSFMQNILLLLSQNPSFIPLWHLGIAIWVPFWRSRTKASYLLSSYPIYNLGQALNNLIDISIQRERKTRNTKLFGAMRILESGQTHILSSLIMVHTPWNGSPQHLVLPSDSWFYLPNYPLSSINCSPCL